MFNYYFNRTKNLYKNKLATIFLINIFNEIDIALPFMQK